MPSLFVLLWVVGLLCVPGGFLIVGCFRTRERTVVRGGELVCVCGYSLTGLPDGSRCPECGRWAEFRARPGSPPWRPLGLLTLGEFVLTAVALAVITRDFSLTLVALIFAWLPALLYQLLALGFAWDALPPKRWWFMAIANAAALTLGVGALCVGTVGVNETFGPEWSLVPAPFYMLPFGALFFVVSILVAVLFVERVSLVRHVRK